MTSVAYGSTTGRQRRRPTLTGTRPHGRPLAPESYPRIVEDYYDAGQAERILAAYPVTDHPSPNVVLATVIGDEGRLAGSCPQLEVLARTGVAAAVDGLFLRSSYAGAAGRAELHTVLQELVRHRDR